MNLTEYRKSNGISVIEMAKLLNKSRQHIYDIEKGNAYPSRKLAKRIETLTKKKVKAAQLLQLNVA